MDISTISKDSSVFILAPYALKIATYTVEVMVVNVIDGLAASAFVSVVVASGPVVAVIAGGCSRSVPAPGSILLDGSGSWDGDYPNRNSAGEAEILNEI